VKHSNGAGDAHLGWVEDRFGNRIRGDDECGSAEECADLDLIASAPELLDALRSLQTKIDAMTFRREDDGRITVLEHTHEQFIALVDALQNARDLVAKAEGRS
jgi:hypothetical protein